MALLRPRSWAGFVPGGIGQVKPNHHRDELALDRREHGPARWPPPRRSAASATLFRARGADVRAISVGAVEHEGSVLVAVPQLRAWFDELAPAAQR